MHAFTFAWMDHPVVLFDGVCNFCNGMINFIISQDKKGVLRFAPLQSNAGKRLIESYGIPAEKFESFILIYKGKALKTSSAALTLFNQLPWYWKWMQIFWIVPPFVRNGVYKLIARNRYKWFGKNESCMVPTAEMRERFMM